MSVLTIKEIIITNKNYLDNKFFVSNQNFIIYLKKIVGNSLIFQLFHRFSF